MFAKDVLGDPVWQGIGAIAGIAAVAAYLWFELRRRRGRSRATRYQVFNLSSETEARAFYAALCKSIREAEETIYRSGRGFSSPNSSVIVRELIDAEEWALRRGVEITRIQTSTRSTEVWADAYATLLDTYGDNLRVLRDFAEPPLVNVALIDPYGVHPIIQLLFESQENTPQGARFRSANAIFLFGENALAASLAQQFNARISELHRMTSDEIRDLARSYIYFAYGSNMSRRQMRERCPESEDLGRAFLYGWQRRFGVAAPHMGAAGALAAGIEQAPNESQYVEGVAYAIVPREKEQLDKIELGGYRPETVGIKLNGRHQEAYTHVPLSMSPDDSGLPTLAYLELMIEGAAEHRLEGSVGELSRLRHDLAQQ